MTSVAPRDPLSICSHQQRLQFDHELVVPVMCTIEWLWPDIRPRRCRNPGRCVASMVGGALDPAHAGQRPRTPRGTPKGQMRTQVRQPTQRDRRRPAATAPPELKTVLGQHVERHARRRPWPGRSTRPAIGVVGHAGHEDALGAEVHRAKLDVRPRGRNRQRPVGILSWVASFARVLGRHDRHWRARAGPVRSTRCSMRLGSRTREVIEPAIVQRDLRAVLRRRSGRTERPAARASVYSRSLKP